MVRKLVLAAARSQKSFLWHPNFTVAESESRGHDANQSPRRAIEIQRSSEYLRVPAEQLAPQSVAHDEHGRRTGFPILLCDPTAQAGFDAKNFKGIRRYPPAKELFGRSAAPVVDSYVGEPDHVFECVVLFLEIEKHRDGEPGNGDLVGQMNRGGRQSIGVPTWEGTE